MSEHIQEAINEYAQSLYAAEMEFNRTCNAQRLEKLLAENPQALDEFREKLQHDAEELAQMMCDPARYAPKLCQGALHTSNPRTRKLFSAVTGIVLPNTIKGTKEVLDGTPYGVAMKVLQDAKDSAAEAKRQRQEEEDRQRELAVLSILEDEVRKNMMIDGEELLKLCRHHGIEVHPRTAGFWRSRVVGINSDRGRVQAKKGQSSDCTSAYRAYRQVQTNLLNQDNRNEGKRQPA